jgi:hypothetical protein
MPNARALQRLTILVQFMAPSVLPLERCGAEPPGGSGGADSGGSADVAGQAGEPTSGGGEGGHETMPTAGEPNGGGAPTSGGTAGISGGGGPSGGGETSIGGSGEGGESGAPGGVVDALPQANVRWLGPCTPIALSDDAQTVLALEGVWTEGTGWIPLPDLPGGEISNVPRTLSGNGRVVYGSSGSELGDEIYRFDVSTRTIEGLGQRYFSSVGGGATWRPETLRTIDTNEDGSVLVGYGSDPEHFRWTASGGFSDILNGGTTNPGTGPDAVVLSSNGETAIFSADLWPEITSSQPVSLASEQYVGTVVYPAAVSGDGKWYTIGGMNFMPDAAPHCVYGDNCWITSFAIFDLDYDGRAGVGMQGWDGDRRPVGTFYWWRPDRVRYLHEALFDNSVLVDVDILSRAAINADGRSVLGTATRHFTDGSTRHECFIGEFKEPIEDAAAETIAEPGTGSQLWTGRGSSCARGADGAIACWGTGIAEMLGRPVSDSWSALTVPPLTGAVQVAPGDGHSCAVFANGTIRCWGNNGSGQLGDGTLESSATPVEVVGVEDALQVAVAGNVTCALHESGSITCWGSYQNGLSAVPALPPARGVALARWGGCAVLMSGQVACWGEFDDGDAPVLEGVSQFVMANDASWCALSDDGSVTCNYPYCEACQPSDYPYCEPTLQLVGSRALTFSGPVREISVGDHVCGLLDDGTVECAGLGNSGQLGARRGLCGGDPAPVPGVTNAVHIASGSNHTCVLLASGAAQCWGLDDKGQLGNGLVYTASLDASKLSPGLSRASYVRLGTD